MLINEQTALHMLCCFAGGMSTLSSELSEAEQLYILATVANSRRYMQAARKHDAWPNNAHAHFLWSKNCWPHIDVQCAQCWISAMEQFQRNSPNHFDLRCPLSVYCTHTHIMCPVSILYTHSYYVSSVYIAHILSLIMCPVHTHSYYVSSVGFAHRACTWLVLGLYLACTILQVNMQSLQLLVGWCMYTARHT